MIAQLLKRLRAGKYPNLLSTTFPCGIAVLFLLRDAGHMNATMFSSPLCKKCTVFEKGQVRDDPCQSINIRHRTRLNCYSTRPGYSEPPAVGCLAAARGTARSGGIRVFAEVLTYYLYSIVHNTPATRCYLRATGITVIEVLALVERLGITLADVCTHTHIYICISFASHLDQSQR
ncbi:hypothetical protein F4803DRAFT_543638 [Xylaria telfairii]|nr:hypothetical protein F4803DRAFT_543638 [Xylaria telfairii]